jgi:hypothetical protein
MVMASLHSDLNIDIYMQLPEGFKEEGYICYL